MLHKIRAGKHVFFVNDLMLEQINASIKKELSKGIIECHGMECSDLVHRTYPKLTDKITEEQISFIS